MGHELDGDNTPIEAGLLFATRKKGGYTGFDALQERLAKGARPNVISLKLDDEDAVPLGHEPIYLDGTIIGHTTSCAFGFRVGKPIALGSVHHAVESGTRVQVDIARVMFEATLIHGPLFDPDGSRMKG